MSINFSNSQKPYKITHYNCETMHLCGGRRYIEKLTETKSQTISTPKIKHSAN